MLVVLLLAGCGRLQFDELAAVTSDAMDATDAAPPPCGAPATAAPTITIRGDTFEYTSFDNDRMAAGSVIVTALDPATMTSIGTMISAVDGAYAIPVSTGGAPLPLAMRYVKAGYFATTVYADLPVTEDRTGQGLAVWSFGDAPIWADANMTATYTASGATREVTAGTLNVAVRDCAGAVVEGVTVTITPAPGKMVYQAFDGRPSMTLTETVLPFGHAFALNAQPGVTRIVATKDGLTFLDTEVTVLADRNNTLAIVRAVD